MVNQPHAPRFLRYQWVYKALMDAGVPIIALKPKSKRPAFGTVLETRIRDLEHLEMVLDDLGMNIGAITHQKDLPGTNPLGFVELDIDKPGHQCDLSQFPLMVRRQGQTDRAHFPFRVPNPQEPIKASLHGTHDVCTWNTVLAGSIHKDGSLYELWIKGWDGWVLWDGEPFSVEMLPIIDPAVFRPVTGNENAEFDEEQEQSPSPTEMGKVKTLRQHKETRPRKAVPVWEAASGTQETRLIKARFYLGGAAWKAVEGKGGHKTFYAVMCNLRLYYSLPFPLVMAIVKQYYNPRCVDGRGHPAPWSDKEIEHKWDEAGEDDAFPTLGTKDRKAKAKVARVALQEAFKEFLDRFTEPGGSCVPTTLLGAFLGFRGGEMISAKAFGAGVRVVTGKGSKSPNGPRKYQGFHLTEAGQGLTNESVVKGAAA